jgi:flavin reductase (DIM6/NTAB) family NADH-FMN oxidoreductase RutF
MSSDASIAAALGRVASGVFILTARRGGDETGMLSSWVMQAGFDPPMVTVAIKQGRYIGDWLTAGESFALNLVPGEAKNLLKHFAHGFEPGQNAFDGLGLRHSAHGLPVLADAMGHLECTPQSHIDSGDHRIFLARIDSGELVHPDERPMVHVRKSGMHY